MERFSYQNSQFSKLVGGLPPSGALWGGRGKGFVETSRQPQTDGKGYENNNFGRTPIVNALFLTKMYTLAVRSWVVSCSSINWISSTPKWTSTGSSRFTFGRTEGLLPFNKWDIKFPPSDADWTSTIVLQTTNRRRSTIFMILGLSSVWRDVTSFAV